MSKRVVYAEGHRLQRTRDARCARRWLSPTGKACKLRRRLGPARAHPPTMIWLMGCEAWAKDRASVTLSVGTDGYSRGGEARQIAHDEYELDEEPDEAGCDESQSCDG